MRVAKWNNREYNEFLSSIQSLWKLNDDSTWLSFVPNSQSFPQQYIKGIGPICDKVIRTKFRINTDGFITKIRLKIGNRRHVFSRCFWKEISLESGQSSPMLEVYATMCASYLRHTKKIKSLAYCYGFINGTLPYFTKECSDSSIKYIHKSEPRFIPKRIEGHRALVQSQNEPVTLLSQEYIPLSFDDVIHIWKEHQYDDATLRLHILQLLYEICDGLYWMEKEWGIYHNDLHPGNIMARPTKDKKNIEWCIIDWGRATVQRDGCWQKNMCFTSSGLAYGQ